MKRLIIINIIVLIMISVLGCSVKNKFQEQRKTKTEKQEETESISNTEIDSEDSTKNNQDTEVVTDQTLESETQEGSNNYTISQNEFLFIFKNDISNEGVIKLLGEPESKSKVEVWGADGLEHQTWLYNKDGIEIDMITEGDIQKVHSLKVIEGNLIKTSKNIGIGSSREELTDAYKNEINTDNTNNSQENQIVVGSDYDGIRFQLENNKVNSFYIGASAE